MRAAVNEKLAEARAVVVRDQPQKLHRFRLDDFIDRTDSRKRARQTVCLWAVLAIVLDSLPRYFGCRRQELRLAGIDDSRRPPEAGEIGMAVIGMRSRTRRRMMAPLVLGDRQRIFPEAAELRSFFELDIEACGFARRHGRIFIENAATPGRAAAIS